MHMELQEHFSINTSQYATLSFRLTAIYCLLNVLLPIITNLLVKRRLKLFFASCAFLLLLGHTVVLCGISLKNQALLLAGYLIFGMGSETISVCCLTFVDSHWGKSGELGFCLSMLTFSSDISRVVCTFTFGLFKARIGFLGGIWASMAFCLVAFGCSLGLCFCVMPPTTTATSCNEKEPKNERRSILFSRNLWIFCLSYTAYYQCITPQTVKWHEYLVQKFRITKSHSEWFVSAASLAGAFANPASGLWLDQKLASTANTQHTFIKTIVFSGQTMFLALVLSLGVSIVLPQCFYFAGMLMAVQFVAFAFFSSAFWSLVAWWLEGRNASFAYGILVSSFNLLSIASAAVAWSPFVVQDCTWTTLWTFLLASLLLGMILFASLLLPQTLSKDNGHQNQILFQEAPNLSNSRCQFH